jgi:hypothetical protein
VQARFALRILSLSFCLPHCASRFPPDTDSQQNAVRPCSSRRILCRHINQCCFYYLDYLLQVFRRPIDYCSTHCHDDCACSYCAHSTHHTTVCRNASDSIPRRHPADSYSPRTFYTSRATDADNAFEFRVPPQVPLPRLGRILEAKHHVRSFCCRCKDPRLV